MTQGVRHDLLHGTHKCRLRSIAQDEIVIDVEIDLETRHIGHDVAQRLGEPAGFVAEVADCAAQITEHLPGDVGCALDVGARRGVIAVAGCLELETQHSEVVADRVMEVTGYPQALRRPRAVGQQCTRRLQLDVRRCEIAPHALFPDQGRRRKHRGDLQESVEPHHREHRRQRGVLKPVRETDHQCVDDDDGCCRLPRHDVHTDSSEHDDDDVEQTGTLRSHESSP